MPTWAAFVLTFPVFAGTPDTDTPKGSLPSASETPFCKRGDPFVLFAITTPPDRDAERKLDLRMQWLAASDASDRERALDVFSSVELYALPRLRILYHNATTEELRDAIRCIVRETYLTACMAADTGYLGVSFANTQRHWTPESGWVDVEPRPRPGEVWDVPCGFPAEQAGIQVGDVITSLDGESTFRDDQFAGDWFRREIRRRKPGTQVIVEVRRNETELSFVASLGAFPPELLSLYRIPVSDDVSDAAQAAFPAWWAKYFEGDLDEKLSAETLKRD